MAINELAAWRQTERVDSKAYLTSLDLWGLKKRLNELPTQIAAAKAAAANARQQFDQAKQTVESVKANIMAEIAAEINPNSGKAAFSNAEARAAELTKRISTDAEFIAAQAAKDQAEKEMVQAQIEAERLQDQFSGTRMVAELTAAELKFLASA